MSTNGPRLACWLLAAESREGDTARDEEGTKVVPTTANWKIALPSFHAFSQCHRAVRQPRKSPVLIVGGGSFVCKAGGRRNARRGVLGTLRVGDSALEVVFACLRLLATKQMLCYRAQWQGRRSRNNRVRPNFGIPQNCRSSALLVSHGAGRIFQLFVGR